MRGKAYALGGFSVQFARLKGAGEAYVRFGSFVLLDMFVRVKKFVVWSLAKQGCGQESRDMADIFAPGVARCYQQLQLWQQAGRRRIWKRVLGSACNWWSSNVSSLSLSLSTICLPGVQHSSQCQNVWVLLRLLSSVEYMSFRLSFVACTVVFFSARSKSFRLEFEGTNRRFVGRSVWENLLGDRFGRFLSARHERDFWMTGMSHFHMSFLCFDRGEGGGDAMGVELDKWGGSFAAQFAYWRKGEPRAVSEYSSEILCGEYTLYHARRVKLMQLWR